MVRKEKVRIRVRDWVRREGRGTQDAQLRQLALRTLRCHDMTAGERPRIRTLGHIEDHPKVFRIGRGIG